MLRVRIASLFLLGGPRGHLDTFETTFNGVGLLACLLACSFACLLACLPSGLIAWLFACLLACLLVSLPGCLPACLLASLSPNTLKPWALLCLKP